MTVFEVRSTAEPRSMAVTATMAISSTATVSTFRHGLRGHLEASARSTAPAFHRLQRPLTSFQSSPLRVTATMSKYRRAVGSLVEMNRTSQRKLDSALVARFIQIDG
jgi:hypothetical protein